VTEKGKLALLEAFGWLALVASIVAITIPKRAEVKRMASARQIVADLETVREAVYAFYSDSAYFPAQTSEEIPESLLLYLPLTFPRTHSYGALEYRNWPVAPAYQDSSAANIVGVTVTTPDPRIGAAAASRTLRLAQFAVENRYTFIYFGK
jgi:hypothetical protein